MLAIFSPAVNGSQDTQEKGNILVSCDTCENGNCGSVEMLARLYGTVLLKNRLVIRVNERCVLALAVIRME